MNNLQKTLSALLILILPICSFAITAKKDKYITIAYNNKALELEKLGKYEEAIKCYYLNKKI